MASNIILGNIPIGPQKIAGFDADWTIIRPNRKKISEHGISHSFLPNRIPVLQWLVQNEYIIVIVSNQKIWNNFKIADAMIKLNWLSSTLTANGIPSVILAATKNNEYRKPGAGWKNHLPEFLPGSFYCGDAAGRPGDFSDSDKKFAEVCGLSFKVPEDVFPIRIPNIDLSCISPALIICVGAPGSGKTTYATNLKNKGWIKISSDDYKSDRAKMLKVLINNFRGRIIIDATNPHSKHREVYIKTALANNMRCYILHFLNHGEDRNSLRDSSIRIPKIAYNVYWSNFIEPSEKEGAEIHQIYN